MPRLARLDAPGILHHVIGRGIEKKRIFFGDQDRSDFLSRLATLGEEKGCLGVRSCLGETPLELRWFVEEEICAFDWK